MATALEKPEIRKLPPQRWPWDWEIFHRWKSGNLPETWTRCGGCGVFMPSKHPRFNGCCSSQCCRDFYN